ncbi:MAG TPA: hypothetical protein VFE05_18375 [Longimicrobiaceae bacterium]|jgi:hypothetical protein|nr:hypothetical protein [Longimicrobiaceae bacterium]
MAHGKERQPGKGPGSDDSRPGMGDVTPPMIFSFPTPLIVIILLVAIVGVSWLAFFRHA